MNNDYYENLKKELPIDEQKELNNVSVQYRNLTLISLIQIHRFKNYITFKKYIENVLFPPVMLKEEILPCLTYTALEWYHVTPLFLHEQSQRVLPLYKDILKEMIVKNHLQCTIGWENLYIRTVLVYWAMAPHPNWPENKQLDEALIDVGTDFGIAAMARVIHPMSSIFARPSITKLYKPLLYRRDYDYRRNKRKGVTIKCPYCICQEVCMASLNTEHNGTCQKGDFRCSVDAGVHLCSKHGEFLQFKSGKINIKITSTLKLNDGREVMYMGWMRRIAEHDPMICVGNDTVYSEYKDLSFKHLDWTPEGNAKILDKFYTTSTELELNTRDQNIREREISNPDYYWVNHKEKKRSRGIENQ